VHCFVVFRLGQPELSFFYLLISDLVLALHTQLWGPQSLGSKKLQLLYVQANSHRIGNGTSSRSTLAQFDKKYRGCPASSPAADGSRFDKQLLPGSGCMLSV
jgi:hypothetical protein